MIHAAARRILQGMLESTTIVIALESSSGAKARGAWSRVILDDPTGPEAFEYDPGAVISLDYHNMTLWII